MLARLEAALEHERRFVADASHELRTPLALLKAELELALPPSPERRGAPRAIGSAAEETDRLVLLAEDLLLIARSDREALGLRMETPSISASWRARPPTASRSARHTSGAGSRSRSRRTPRCPADRLRLAQALRNLVDNALDYGDGTVTMSARRTGEAIKLHVRDEGRGSRPTSPRVPWSGSRGATTPAAAEGAGSGSRSSTRSRRRTAARRASPRTVEGRAWISLPPHAELALIGLSSRSHVARLPRVGQVVRAEGPERARRRRQARLGLLRRRAALASALGFAGLLGLAAQRAVGSTKRSANAVSSPPAAAPAAYFDQRAGGFAFDDAARRRRSRRRSPRRMSSWSFAVPGATARAETRRSRRSGSCGRSTSA